MKGLSYQFIYVVIHVVISSHYICLISSTCALPDPIPNTLTTLSNQTLATGSHITWECRDGYMMDGLTNDAVWVCLEDGSWLGHTPICKDVACPSPPIAAYSELDPPSAEAPVVNQTISYRCISSKYTLLGSNLNRCLQDGTWENDPPICQRDCGGTTDQIKRYSDLTCYRLLGGNSTRNWSRSLETCNDNGELLATVKDAETQTFLVDFIREHIRYGAWIGAMEGRDWMWRHSGKYIERFFWQTPFPNANSKDCIELSYQDGSFSWSPKSNQTGNGLLCQYDRSCQSVGLSQSDMVLEYMDNCFQFLDVSKNCDDGAEECNGRGGFLAEILDESTNAVLLDRASHLRDINTAWWIGGYDENSGRSWYWSDKTRMNYEEWSSGEPSSNAEECLEMKRDFQYEWNDLSCYRLIQTLCQIGIPACGDPGEPLHGNRLPDDRTTYSDGATLHFTCQEGYTLSGESVLRCMNNGAWNHQRPSCEAVECEGSPPEVALASIKILGSAFQDIAVYTCQDGYIPDNKPISFCQHSGIWSSPNFTCNEFIPCNSNPCINGGTCFDVYESSFNCTCTPDYTGPTCNEKRQCWNATVATVFGQARLPMTDVGIVIDSEELCPDEDSEGLAAPIIRAVCQVSSDGETYWNSSIRCQENITRELRRILMNGIYEANVTDVAEEVFTITQNYEEIEDEDIGLLYEILQLIRSPNPDANVAGLIVGIVNNVMFVEDDVLASAQENGNYTSLIVQVLESQLNTVDVGNNTLAATYPNIAVQVLDVPSDTAGNGIVVTILSMDTGNLSNSAIMVETHQDDPNDSVPRDTFARVVVPIEVAQVFTTPEFTEGPSSSNYTTNGDNHGTTTASGVSSGPVKMVDESAIESLRVSFVVYVNDVMFPSPSLALLNREINTPVVSLTIGGQKIEDLMERVNITFYRFELDSSDPTCTFWENNLGKWSVEGCQLLPDNIVNSSSNEYYTCACDHLTSFAVLVNIHVDAVPTKPALRILSIIGCAISCVCLVIAIASYLTIKNINQSTKIFICLCTTLLCLYTVSLAIIALDTKFQYAEVELIPCTVLATLVHYFVLSSLTWMGIEGFSLAIIKRIDNQISMTKVSIVGWGIPAVIVAVTGGITRNYYAVKDYCYIRKWPLIGGLLIPMAIILIINITVFILAMCRVEKSVRTSGRVKKDRKTERHDTLKRIQNGIATLILLGCTWTTGYLALINVDYTELLFIIFNSLQGFFIFVLYCLRNTEIRKNWRRCICSRLLRKGGRWSPKEVPDEHQ